jgi:hypothetical protein
MPFIPIDSVYQTEDSSYVFVVQNKKAVSKKIKLGAVTGRFVQVESGLTSGNNIILERNIVTGDQVTTSN